MASRAHLSAVENFWRVMGRGNEPRQRAPRFISGHTLTRTARPSLAAPSALTFVAPRLIRRRPPAQIGSLLPTDRKYEGHGDCFRGRHFPRER